MADDLKRFAHRMLKASEEGRDVRPNLRDDDI